MKTHYQDKLPDMSTIYQQIHGAAYDAEVAPLIARYQELYLKIVGGAERTAAWRVRTAGVSDLYRIEMNVISKAIQIKQNQKSDMKQ